MHPSFRDFLIKKLSMFMISVARLRWLPTLFNQIEKYIV